MSVIYTLTAPEESKEEHICLVFPQQCFESRLTWLEQDVLTRLSGPNMHEYKGQVHDASSNLMISWSCGIIEKERSLLITFSASSLLSPLLMLHTLLLSRMVSYSRGWIMSRETSSSSTEKGMDPRACLLLLLLLLPHYLLDMLPQKSLTFGFTRLTNKYFMNLFLWILHFVPLLNRSKKAVTDSSELSISEKNKAIEDGQNNNVEPADYVSG